MLTYGILIVLDRQLILLAKPCTEQIHSVTYIKIHICAKNFYCNTKIKAGLTLEYSQNQVFIYFLPDLLCECLTK